LLGSVNVYNASLHTIEPDTAAGVRVIEGFSTEEGFPGRFGSTLHDGAAQLGVVPVQADGSWAALVPAAVPVQTQVVDAFGMALATEPVWISGAAGESRFCAGCHEDRSSGSIAHPGVTEAAGVGPYDLMSTVTRDARMSMDFTRDAVVGVPWDLALQPIFDTHCVSCHNGGGGAANPSWTVSDPEGGGSFSWTFDLRGRMVNAGGVAIFGGYSASYISLIGLDPELLQRADLVVTGTPPNYVEPQNARESELIRLLNPMQMFPTMDAAVRAFSSTPHGDTHGFALTPEEHYLLVLMADMGGQFYSRENKPAP
jgi:mono/diheme cytochrome c family protein